MERQCACKLGRCQGTEQGEALGRSTHGQSAVVGKSREMARDVHAVHRSHAELAACGAQVKKAATVIPRNSLIEANQSGLIAEPLIDITPQLPIPDYKARRPSPKPTAHNNPLRLPKTTSCMLPGSPSPRHCNGQQRRRQTCRLS